MSTNPDEEPDPQRLEAEDGALWAAARQAIYERQRTLSAPQVTAARLDESAASHERIAAML
jgi:hypothetical protein